MLAGEAIDAGLQVAVCSTSNERAVSKIVEVLLGSEVASQMKIYAGDIVPKKKPDPAVYILAAKELSVDPSRCATCCGMTAAVSDWQEQAAPFSLAM